LTEEGVVVIEVRGDAILISECMDDETTNRVERDYWPETK
jgi:predicted RNA-binding protein